MEKQILSTLEKLKNKKNFEFIKDTEIKKILYDFLAYSLVNFKEVEDWIVNNQKVIELKIHTVLVYLGSIIEAVLYYFVDEKLKNNDKKRKKYLKIKEYQEIQKLKLPECNYFSVCKISEKELDLNDTINFNALINWAKDNKLINEEIFEKINEVRKMRNSVHINVYKLWKLKRFDDLKKVLIDVKEIIDYLDNNLKEIKS